jgi:photosystem II stability/assembly factor-like uncharacterized protein
MKRKLLFPVLLLIIYLVILNPPLKAQGWIPLGTGPTAGWRFEDVNFPNTQTGYVITWSGTAFKTTNGGGNWFSCAPSQTASFRSLGFFNASTGIIGTLTAGRSVYRTTDGGTSWNIISTFTGGSAPGGICGISILNSTTGFAVGRYSCPAYFIKTTNAGENWTSVPVNPALATSLVDCYFWSKDTGIVVGGWSPTNSYSNSYSVVLFTTNGGESFTQVYKSSIDREWCWKINFINRTTGFVSLESTQRAGFLKTTDGGYTWVSTPIPVTRDIQGIGFINENTGWVGGFDTYSYGTTDGGATWSQLSWGKSHNRFRFFGDSLAYSVGVQVYKYTKTAVSVNQIFAPIPENYSLMQNFPNPFNPSTVIKYTLPEISEITLTVYDVRGNEIENIVTERQAAGSYSYTFNASGYPSGIYFYKLETMGFSETKKMVLVK